MQHRTVPADAANPRCLTGLVVVTKTNKAMASVHVHVSTSSCAYPVTHLLLQQTCPGVQVNHGPSTSTSRVACSCGQPWLVGTLAAVPDIRL